MYSMSFQQEAAGRMQHQQGGAGGRRAATSQQRRQKLIAWRTGTYPQYIPNMLVDVYFILVRQKVYEGQYGA
jgi:hypothetical protein